MWKMTRSGRRRRTGGRASGLCGDDGNGKRTIWRRTIKTI
jgi:hypothetical protein